MILRMRPVWPAAATAAFVLLAILVVAAWPPLDGFDTATSGWFRRYGAAHPGFIAVVRIATDVASTVAYLIAGLLVALVLAIRRQRRAAAFGAAVTVAVPVLWALLHWLLPRPRPIDAFVTVASNGFPSGHTAHAAAAALVAVLLCWQRLRRAGRLVLIGTAAGLAVLIGVSRVVLLAHWPSDVLGGWLLALAVVPMLGNLIAGWQPTSSGAIGAAADRPAASPPRPPTSG